MKGNVVVAAAVFGGSLIVGCLILVLGLLWAADGAMVRFETALAGHGKAVDQGARATGAQIRDGVDGLSASLQAGAGQLSTAVRAGTDGMAGAIGKHAETVERTGGVLSRPVVGIKGPIDVAQPLRIEGTGAGVIPVEPRVVK
jgi:hypothetical protein